MKKRILSIVLAALLILPATLAASARSFPDVPMTERCAAAVDVLSEIGVILGGTDGNFNPNRNVTREQMAMFIARFESGQPTVFVSDPGAKKPFPDLKDPTYYPAISYAVQKGIINGRSKDVYDGLATVSFSESVKMVVAAMQYNITPLDGSNWYIPYISKAQELGILDSFENKSPSAPMTRGEVAILLYNAFEAPMNESVSETQYVNGVPMTVVRAKTFARDRFFAATVRGTITATKNYAIDGYALATPTKASQNPIRIDASATTYDLYNDFSNTAGLTPEELLGTEVSFTTISGKIISGLTIAGVNTDVKSAEYNNTSQILILNSDVLDLKSYAEDRIVYTLSGSKLIKLPSAEYEKLLLVNNGFYKIDYIKNPNYSDIVIFYPMSVGVIDDIAQGKISINGSSVTDAVVFDNTSGAVKGDMVVYYAANKTIIVSAKAEKSEVVTVKTLFTGANKATMTNGITYEKLPYTTLGASGYEFALGNSYIVYSVGSKVVYVANSTGAAGEYKPARSYSIFERTRTQTTNSFGTVTYPVTTVDANGNIYNFEAKNLNGTAVSTSSKWLSPNSNALGIDGRIVVRDGGDIYTSASADKFYTVQQAGTNAGEIEYALSSGTSVTSSGTNLYSVNTSHGAKLFTMRDYSVIVLKPMTQAEYNGTAATTDPSSSRYQIYKGTSGLASTGIIATSSRGWAILYGKSADSIQSLVFMYIEGVVTHYPNITAPSTASEDYIIIDELAVSADVKLYRAQNLRTGVINELTLKKPISGAFTQYFARGDVAKAEGNILVANIALTANRRLLRYENGFIFAGDTPYNTGSAVVLYYDATTAKFSSSSDASLAHNKYGAVIPASGTTGLAEYIIVQG